MKAEVRTLQKSPTVKVLDFRCQEAPHTVSSPESYPEFEISFTRTGHFHFRCEQGSQDMDSRMIMLANAESERVVSHGKDVCDTCTILHYPRLLLEEAEQIFWRKGVLPESGKNVPFPVAAVPSTPLLDLLHRSLLCGKAETLQVDDIALRILAGIFRQIYGWKKGDVCPAVEEHLRDRHLQTVERAKEYMLSHIDQDISLSEIARHAFVSEFHFSRLFKKLTTLSPYQYLLEARLGHAAILLKKTRDPVTEICFASGFQSFPHFVASFTSRHGISPLQYRKNGRWALQIP